MSKQRVLHEIRGLIRDAEGLLEATTGEVGDRIQVARSRLNGALESARHTCERLEENAEETIEATDKWIRRHPYESIGVALGTGLFAGLLLLLTRRD